MTTTPSLLTYPSFPAAWPTGRLTRKPSGQCRAGRSTLAGNRPRTWPRRSTAERPSSRLRLTPGRIPQRIPLRARLALPLPRAGPYTSLSGSKLGSHEQVSGPCRTRGSVGNGEARASDDYWLRLRFRGGGRWSGGDLPGDIPFPARAFRRALLARAVPALSHRPVPAVDPPRFPFRAGRFGENRGRPF